MFDQQQVIFLVSRHFRLVRTEFGHNQDEMALRIGMSKKTLIQVEKERNVASWVYIVALCAIYQESKILHDLLGGDPLELIKTLAHEDIYWQCPKTMGGRFWWVNKSEESVYRLQQNVISRHYRILDRENRRLFSSINKEYIYERFEELKRTKS